ncbi:MAG: acyltransferase [Candidatus Altiarchaeota archaeon]|nr:acyltransferase [Candidatus Altiarchaeota archaeon]
MNNFWRFCIKIAFLFIPQRREGDKLRGMIYKPFLKKCGKDFRVYDQAFIYEPNSLSVGDNVLVGFNAYIGAGEVHLGDGVTLGPFSMLAPTNRLRKHGSFRFGGIEAGSIHIGSGTQVAAHACITYEVKIGKGCLVAAGAVVTKSFKDNVLIGGVPAKVIKEYDDTQT